jgi:hypothetical protein
MKLKPLSATSTFAPPRKEHTLNPRSLCRTLRRTLQLSFLASLLVLLSVPGFAAQAEQGSPVKTTIHASSIPSQELLQVADLVPLLQAQEKPLVLQVGSHVLYAQAHIPGSEYVGAAGTPMGIQTLRERVSALRKDQFIVIYCGCCPWERCPNIGSAYKQLHTLGFTHVKALYIPDDFGVDWVDKGFPVARGR